MKKAQEMFDKDMEEVRSDLGRLQLSWCTFQITIFTKIGEERETI